MIDDNLLSKKQKV